MQVEISFHNTVPIGGNELRESKAITKMQDALILEWFEYYHALDFTPCEIHANFNSMLLTSVRRSITNLTNAGYLVKHSKKKGVYGKTTNTWKLK